MKSDTVNIKYYEKPILILWDFSRTLRSVPKPLKVPSLARSVQKPLKVPSLALSVPKPLKVPSLACSVPKAFKMGQVVGGEVRGTTPPSQL